jgi:hypothetical protein
MVMAQVCARSDLTNKIETDTNKRPHRNLDAVIPSPTRPPPEIPVINIQAATFTPKVVSIEHSEELTTGPVENAAALALSAQRLEILPIESRDSPQQPLTPPSVPLPKVSPTAIPSPVISTGFPAAPHATSATVQANILAQMRHITNWTTGVELEEPRTSQGTGSTDPLPLEAVFSRYQRQDSVDSIRSAPIGRTFSESEILYVNYVIENLYQLIVETALDNAGIQYRNTFAWKFQVHTQARNEADFTVD